MPHSRFTIRQALFASAFCMAASVMQAQSVMVSPSSVDFGSQPAGSIGNPWTLTVNNTGPAPVALGTISLSDATDFTLSTTCGTMLGAYTNCNVMVGFSPSTSGLIAGQLLVPVVGTTLPLTVALNGVGTSVAPALPNPNFAPGNINFGSQTLATSSNAFTATLNNTGPGALDITSLTVSDPADFSVTSTCGTQVAGYSNCQVLVVFTPTTVGPVAGSLTLVSSGTPQTMTLQGMGVEVKTSVVVAPTAINFGSQAVGLAGNSQIVTVNNTGSNTIALTNFQVAGSQAFGIVNNACGSTLAGNSTCNVPVVFTPAVAGAAAGQLTFSANGIAQSVPLQGTGIVAAPSLFISPEAVDFGTVVAGTTVGPWTISVNNTSAAAIALSQASGVSGSSAFSISSNCFTTIAVHTSCNVFVSFAPPVAGAYSGAIGVQIAGAVSPQVISLSGNAVSALPTLLVAPSAVDFGTVQTGTTASAWTLSVSNPTAGAVTFASPITVGGSREFAISSTCGGSLAAYSSCQVMVTFAPIVPEQVHGQLVVTVAGGSTQTVPLTGTGVGAALTPTVSISPLVYDFGSVVLGKATADVLFTVTNAGSTDAYFSANGSITGSTAFVIDQNGCVNPVPAGTSCVISVSFAPSVSGTATGELLVPFFGLANPLVVGLNGTGGAPAKLEVTPPSVTFGNQALGLASATQNVSLVNSSGAAIPYTLGALPAGFSATTSCTNSVPANSSCKLSLVFAPTVLGTQSGVLSIDEHGQPSVGQLSFTGTGIAPTSFTFSPASGSLTPNVAVGQTYTQIVTVTNSGAAAKLGLGAVSSSLGGWSQTSTTCGPTLGAGASCSVTLAFTPTAARPDTVSLTLTDATNNWPYTWTMIGQGIAAPTPGLVASPTSLQFPNFTWNYTNGGVYLKQITLSNPTTGIVAFAVNSGDPDFVVFNGGVACEVDGSGYYHIAPGQSCIFNVAYYLATVFPRDGQVNSTISFTTSAGSTTSVAVSGYSPYGDNLSPSTFSLSTNSLAFGAAALGSTSQVQTVTVTNTSSATDWIWVASDWNGSPFAPNFQVVQDTCDTYVAPHATCSVGIVFAPSVSGPITNYLQFLDDNSTSIVTLPLLGSGFGAGASGPTPIGSYSLQVYPGELTLSSGQSGSAKFTLTPIGGFKGTVTLSCGPLPIGVTCSFNPPILSADGSNTQLTSTLTISTVGGSGHLQNAKGASFGLLAALSLLGMCFARRRLRPGLMPLAMALLMAALAAGSVGCGTGLATVTSPTGASTVVVKAATVVNGSNGSTTVDQYASFKLTIN